MAEPTIGEKIQTLLQDIEEWKLSTAGPEHDLERAESLVNRLTFMLGARTGQLFTARVCLEATKSLVCNALKQIDRGEGKKE